MKKVTIYPYSVGLLFRKGNFIRLLPEGSYWLRWADDVKTYSLTQPFHAPVDLNLLLQDRLFAEMIQVVEVKDHELCLMFREGNFSEILKPGRYPFWKSVVNYTFEHYDMNVLEVPESLDRQLMGKESLYSYMRVYMVQSFEVGLLTVDGKIERKLGPGTYYFWKNEQQTSLLKADLRQQQMEVSGQEILTKDKAALRLNFDARYQVVEVEKALVETNNYAKVLYVRLQQALREYVGQYTLDELLANKEGVADFVKVAVGPVLAEMGVELLDCGIRDIILPGEMKEIMNQVLIAQKQAQANTIARREETAATRSLLNTAKLMEDNQMLFKLKEMEYVEKIAEKINSISLSGGGQIVDQLRQIFGAKE
ncbi:MAG: slipin family protein [Bacteroidota bacterium]